MLLIWESSTWFVFITLLSCTICKDKWGSPETLLLFIQPLDSRQSIGDIPLWIYSYSANAVANKIWLLLATSLFTKNKRFVASCLFFPNGRIGRLTRKSIEMLPYFAEKNFLCRIKCRKSKLFQGPFLLIKATFKWSVIFPVGKYVHM